MTLHDYKKRHKTKFQDKYFRDVPSDDHPAVLGCLYHDDKVEQSELTAALMRLTNLEVIKIERVKAAGQGARGVRNAADYRIARTGVEPSDPSDVKTVELLFEKLGPLASDEGRAATCDSIMLSDLNRAARRHKGAYANHVAEWKKLMSQRAHSRRFFTDHKHSNRGKLENYLVASVVVSSLSFGALGGAF